MYIDLIVDEISESAFLTLPDFCHMLLIFVCTSMDKPILLHLSLFYFSYTNTFITLQIDTKTKCFCYIHNPVDPLLSPPIFKTARIYRLPEWSKHYYYFYSLVAMEIHVLMFHFTALWSLRKFIPKILISRHLVAGA